MKTDLCDQVEAYLDGDLSPIRKRQFRDHAEACVFCRKEIAADRRLDELLGAARESVGPGPAASHMQTILVRRIRRRESARWAFGLATCLLLCVLAWRTFEPVFHRLPAQIQGGPVAQPPADSNDERSLQLVQKPPVDNAPRPNGPNLADASHEASALRSKAEVSVDVSPDYLAVPVRTENANVTILWLYPTVKAATSDASSSQTRNFPLIASRS